MGTRTVRRTRASRKGVLGLIRSLYQRGVLRPYFYVAGLVHLRRGRLPEAESCFCRAVLLDPRGFATRVQLGRVYFLMEEFFKAEQQFLKAQEIDPRRFHRNHLPEDYTCWEEMDADARRPECMFGDYEAEGSVYAFDETARDEDDEDEDEGFRCGDFSSYQEWKRFQTLPPISRAEIKNTDWDQIFSDPAL